MTATLIILTKNEIEGLKQIFPKIDRTLFMELIACDGGSGDGTLEFYKEHGVQIQPEVKYGDVFRAAAQIAKGEIIIFFRPDGNEDPRDLPKLIQYIKDGADHVIASRFMMGSRNEEDDSILKIRAWANRMFTLLANIFFNRTGIYITDTINGYRAVRADKLREMKLDAPGFSIEYQMTIRSLKLGHKIREIPTIEGNRIGGRVKASSIPVGMEMLRRLITEIAIGKNF
ncbi:MAG: glycosyltransferase family 2 protein [Candidatus Sungbacteria bacterium]|nr:glycosyltransferase family 2 protein [Candidatus Sungbacteria bacterium]